MLPERADIKPAEPAATVCPMDDRPVTPVLTSLEALAGATPEIADGFLIAAVYIRSIRTGRSPRDVLDALWKSMPHESAWPGLRDALVASLSEDDEGGP